MLDLLLTFGVGVLASIVSGMAGGGGGLISAPFFIFIGLPPQIALATTKFGALGLTLGAIAKFRKTEHVRKDFVIFLSLLSIAAAIAGSRILLSSTDEYIEKLVGMMMLATIPFLFMKEMGLQSFKPSYWKEVLGYIFYFVVLVLQAAFGAGVGMMLMVVMMGLFGFTALESNATRRIPGFILAAVSLGIYIFNDVVYYGHGLAMLAGMIVGGYIGTHIAIKKGSGFVKMVFAIVVAIMGLQLVV
ncbi:MAG: sulfite exporter TauE/SafE family protein [Candidatus Andersenbacteria bacterium]|nr:sulfite exporter TauE/SafE family protein [Candidatus Andersenbacteria bacterium]MBI3250622.1 sulfite exporter TauE/SafE family protein [Candidatus Andersenbacteria bacterium]